MIKENTYSTKVHYYDYLALLKKIMAPNNEETVDNLFDLQFSFHSNENIVTAYDVNEQQIKILSRVLCRESLDSLLQSTWFLRKKYCFVVISKEEVRDVIGFAHTFHAEQPHSTITPADWDKSLRATVNINEHMRLIQAVIKPLFIWWAQHITPQLFTLYETKRELELQIKQCENIKSFEEKQLSNKSDPFLSLDDINIKLNADKVRLIVINNLLQKDIQLLLDNWKSEPIFNVEINNTLDYIQKTTPSSELIKPLWEILNSIPEHPENCQKLKNWLLERELCLKNDEFLWQ
ncbi:MULTISPECIES: T3SS regulon anti-activator ExsD domain-containing protein [Proteus]|uniref:T3SS regulon anti-activator ExsD domain-containing protein n=1 Tax=Proteus TaxID=583 RepID=UPI001CBDEB57|nr:T3SS regulon anti-activator ExsD domain-containing protein [Proteus terrae]MCM2367070.1 T3SS regulon anti-activator ExsD family protein [Proteus sp. FZP2095]UDF24954.1 T3SS regulon anti-activator ExsD family protein [Proteus terrae subsp. cibarius]WCG85731.1 T3SS regulon anti-activator ExsD family protein [Proteus terrae]WCG89361.1 T3SS regulon anti-activator ExsD family protein [Proteus terrae]